MDSSDFTSYVAQNGYTLQPYALSLTRNIEDANDLIQETLLRALKSEDKYTGGTNLKAWMYTIMKHIFINNYRRGKTKTSIVSNLEDIFVTDSSYNKIPNLGEVNLCLENVNQALDKLNDTIRVPFLMHYQGYKYNEIAQDLTLPIGTVKSRIHIARKSLQKQLERY